VTFAYPWLLLLIPIMGWVLLRHRDRTSISVAAVEQWSGEAAGRARFLWIPVFLRRAAIILLILAMARPQGGETHNVEVTEGIAIQLLVDISSSMSINAEGPQGGRLSRMEVTRELVERFIVGDGDKLQGRPNDLIGLITFARYADTRSPLTFGHDALVQIVRSLRIQERPNEDGTAIGDAIALAAARLKQMEELRHRRDHIDIEAIQSKVIILLTDGENNSGSHLPLEAAGLAKAWGCRIYAISLGDTVDALGGRRDESSDGSGSATLSASDRILEIIARETGGIFRRAHDYESLAAVYAEIDRLETTEMATRSLDRVADFFWLPLAAGFLMLTFSLILEATWLRVTP
jgi:Ca-activated chloride channel family protein